MPDVLEWVLGDYNPYVASAVLIMMILGGLCNLFEMTKGYLQERKQSRPGEAKQKARKQKPPKAKKPPIPIQAGQRIVWLPGTLSFVRECQLDECVTHRYVKKLGRHGYKVVTTQDLGLVQASDPKQLAVAAKARRILITEDTDFLKLDAQGFRHAGIIYVPRGEEWEQEVVRIVLGLFTCSEVSCS